VRPMLKSASPLLILACSACSDTCNNDVQRAAEAPDGEHTAILFQRDCGATTGFSTQVSVLDAGDRPLGGGNVFVADTDRGSAEPASWGGPWADVTWRSPQHLVIRYDARSRVFERAGQISGVRVTYEKVTR
jgi:hypothetical protein